VAQGPLQLESSSDLISLLSIVAVLDILAFVSLIYSFLSFKIEFVQRWAFSASIIGQDLA
jgi:hypothetical protein